MNIYFDYAATTPQAPAVTRYIYDVSQSVFGNPSSVHQTGRQSRVLIEEARDKLAKSLGCLSAEIVLTSGGSEANNLALTGVLSAQPKEKQMLIISASEHHSVLETARILAIRGFEVQYLPTNIMGVVDINRLSELINSHTALVSVMAINNETGVIQPVQEIAELCAGKNVLFHTDAVQAFGKIQCKVDEIKADLISLSAHKIYGPKGAGALYIRRGTLIKSQLYGGGQEANRRAGTENFSGVIGFGKAIDELNVNDDSQSAQTMQRYFESKVQQIFPQTVIVGGDAERTPFISCIAFPGTANDRILYRLDLAGISVSVGSACSSGSIRPSHVLQAMGLEEKIINSAVRFSFGRYSKLAEIDYLIENLKKIINQ